MPVQPEKPADRPSPLLPVADESTETFQGKVGKSRQRKVTATQEIKSPNDSDSGYLSDESGRSLSERSTSVSSASLSDTLDSPDGLEDQTFLPPQDTKECFNQARVYQVENTPFAQGNFGKIYLVRQKTERQYAHKPDSETEKETVNSFALKVPLAQHSLIDEQKVMEQLPPHRNIVEYQGDVDLNGKAGLMYEYLDGPKLMSLTDNLCDSGLPAQELFNAWKYLEQQKFRAVAHVHQNGLVHADLKPDNFHFHKPTWEVKLLDFGSAVKIGEPFVSGHENYTAPEALDSLLKGKQAGVLAQPSMDCYALGQMLYRELTGLQGHSHTFLAGAGVDSLPPGERGVRLFLIKKAMESNYLPPQKDGSYKTVLPAPSPEVTDNDINLESVRISRQDAKSSESDSVDTWEPEGFDIFHESALQFKQEQIHLTRLINGLMHPDPRQRLTASQALKHPWFTSKSVDDKKAVQTLSRFL